MTHVLYQHATIITINTEREIILDGAILTTHSRITLIGTTAAVLANPIFTRLCKDEPQSIRIIDLTGRVIIPGLVNTHCHTIQSILRGLAEDLWLHPWMCDAIWPLEASYVEDDGYHAARLTIAESLKGGTTTVLEAMLTHRAGFENVVRAVGESGIRACLGKLVKSQETNPSTNIQDARDKDLAQMSLASALSAHNTHHGTFGDRLHVWMAAGTPRGSPLSEHRAIGEACRSHGISLTMHCAEAARDRTIYHDHYEGRTPMQFCEDASLVAPQDEFKTVLAHMVHIDTTVDMPLLQKYAHGTSVAHNPTSNCKLASGVAPIPELLADGAGITVGLGTDGAPCNNTYDMFREMHLACILHAGTRQQAGVVPATKALEMATINGARALDLDKDIGSLEVGKKADLVVVRVPLSGVPFEGGQVDEGGVDPVSVIVHGCTAADVEMVVVDGGIVVEDGKLLTMNEEEVVREARRAIRGIRERAGVKARPREGWKITV